MKIEKTKYVIVTKNSPLKFDDGYGNSVDSIDEAAMWCSEGMVNEAITYFDEPECHKILQVKITYEF